MASEQQSILALRLRLLRVASGMKQEDIARELEVGRSAYAYYELSRSKPDYDALMKLAKLFNVTVDYLIGMSNFPDGSSRKIADDDDDETEQAPERMMGQLRPEERHLMCLYRRLPEDERADLVQELEKKLYTK